MQEEEEKKLQLMNEWEKRWLVELATQQQQEQMVEVKGEGSSKSGDNWMETARGARYRRRFVSDQGKSSCLMSLVHANTVVF